MATLNVYEVSYNLVKSTNHKESAEARSVHKKILVATTDQPSAESKVRAAEASGTVHIESIRLSSMTVLT
jgi:hypothetical protein